jgi:CHRD domain
MRTRLFVLAGVLVGVLGVAAMGATAASTGSTTTLGGHLTGGVETPKGDVSGKGTATITLNTKTGKVCWKFAISKIDGAPTAAHIHKGGKGVAGPVVVPFGAAYKKTGCTTASKSVVKAIVAKPSKYYVNVHNGKHPAGALRSQLSKMM